jgi:hypothetical protein
MELPSKSIELHARTIELHRFVSAFDRFVSDRERARRWRVIDSSPTAIVLEWSATDLSRRSIPSSIELHSFVSDLDRFVFDLHRIVSKRDSGTV